ncbi:hypothetical protein ACOZXQ_000570 [Cronobacter malonaticus]
METTLGRNLPPFSVPGVRIIGGQPTGLQVTIREKLSPENRTDLGSTTVLGRVFNTRSDYYHVLELLNAYLRQPLTEDELDYIMQNRRRFVFYLGVGDRRNTPNFIRRFVFAENWHGEDVSNFSIEPDAYSSPRYNFLLFFDGSAKIMQLTDSHSGPNAYGAIRAFYVAERQG